MLSVLYHKAKKKSLFAREDRRWNVIAETLQGEQGKGWSFFPAEKTREKQFETRDRSEALITSLTNETSSLLENGNGCSFVRSFVRSYLSAGNRFSNGNAIVACRFSNNERSISHL